MLPKGIRLTGPLKSILFTDSISSDLDKCRISFLSFLKFVTSLHCVFIALVSSIVTTCLTL